MTISAQFFRDQNGFEVLEAFEAFQAGDAQVASTGLLRNGGSGAFADISTLLAPLSVGTAIAYQTHLVDQNGNDLSALFAKKGSRAGSALSATIPSNKAYRDTTATGANVGGSILCQAAGGTSPYTFAWTLVSGVNCIVGGAATDTVTVSYAAAPSPGNEAVLKCTVTDANSTVVDSNTCTVRFYFISGV